jgi:hypothetical protein
MLIGGDAGATDADVDLGVDVDVDMDVDTGPADAEHGDPGQAMKVLSIQSIVTFLMGVRWGGLAGLHGFDLAWGPSALVGTAVGATMVWVLGLLLKGVHDLQSSGNIAIDSALGAEGTVYVGVPPHGEGRGQVRVVVDGRQRIYDAVSDGGALARHEHVRVVRVHDDHTLTVLADQV